MPKRLLRDGILTSDRVAQLDWAAEVFYRRLMSVADDFGRYDGRVSMLKAHLYPLVLDKVREADVSRWLAECEKAGLIRRYEADSKPFVEILRFGQRKRTSRYPPPPGESDPPSDGCGGLPQSAADSRPFESEGGGADEGAVEDEGAGSRASIPLRGGLRVSGSSPEPLNRTSASLRWLEACRPLWGSCGPSAGKHGEGTPQYVADETSTPRLFDRYVWPPGMSDRDGARRFGEAMGYVKSAARKPKPMAWLTNTLKNRLGDIAA